MATDRAGDRNRTRGIQVTSKALYQLSYTGKVRRTSYVRAAQLIPPSKARIEPVIIRAAGEAR